MQTTPTIKEIDREVEEHMNLKIEEVLINHVKFLPQFVSAI